MHIKPANLWIVPPVVHSHNHCMTHRFPPLSSSTAGLHTILGAGGVIGRELSKQLARERRRVRQVGRHPVLQHAGDELVIADLTNAHATAAAVAGSEVVYLVAGLAYNTAIWQAHWPVVMCNVIEACGEHGARLVFLDNVYAYGRVDGVMTEDTPFNPCSRKGEVRAAIASTLLESMRRGQVQALIARSADFYGPGAHLSLLEAVLFSRLRAGKAPQWVGDPEAVHTFTHTPDIGRALAALGRSPAAFGQTWHMPTASQMANEAVTGRALTRAACTLADQPIRLQVAPRWLFKAMGWCVPLLRENNEMLYQLEHAYRFDSSKTDKALGWYATPYGAGLRQTVLAGTPS
jgi:nucleoside-diphosphate-sugar epimerase